jgi:hypothetical protein
VNANEAKQSTFQEKLKKAKKEGKCVYCQEKSCIEERIAESGQTHKKWTKIPCKNKATKAKNAKVDTGNKSDDSDTEDIQDQCTVDVECDFKPVEMRDYFADTTQVDNGMNYIIYPDGSSVFTKINKVEIEPATVEVIDEEDDWRDEEYQKEVYKRNVEAKESLIW